MLDTGLQFGVWEFPGDTLSSVDWSITQQENGPWPSGCLGFGTASGSILIDTVYFLQPVWLQH